MKKPVPGVLSGMVFLLARTTRTRQRWRDGEGAFALCLRRDVTAINKMHFRCERYRAATTPHTIKLNRRSRPNKHCLALPVSARASGKCRAQASGRCAGVQVYPRQGVAVRTGAAMPLLYLAAGGWGTLAGKRPHISREATTTRQDIDRHDHAAKKRRGDATSAPFFCLSPQVMEFDFDLCGGIYPKGARHNGLLCEPEGREFSGACALHKTPLCLIPPHTQPAQPTKPCRDGVRPRHVKATPCTSNLRTASA